MAKKSGKSSKKAETFDPFGDVGERAVKLLRGRKSRIHKLLGEGKGGEREIITGRHVFFSPGFWKNRFDLIQRDLDIKSILPIENLSSVESRIIWASRIAHQCYDLRYQKSSTGEDGKSGWYKKRDDEREEAYRKSSFWAGRDKSYFDTLGVPDGKKNLLRVDVELMANLYGLTSEILEIEDDDLFLKVAQAEGALGFDNFDMIAAVADSEKILVESFGELDMDRTWLEPEIEDFFQEVEWLHKVQIRVPLDGDFQKCKALIVLKHSNRSLSIPTSEGSNRPDIFWEREIVFPRPQEPSSDKNDRDVDSEYGFINPGLNKLLVIMVKEDRGDFLRDLKCYKMPRPKYEAKSASGEWNLKSPEHVAWKELREKLFGLPQGAWQAEVKVLNVFLGDFPLMSPARIKILAQHYVQCSEKKLEHCLEKARIHQPDLTDISKAIECYSPESDFSIFDLLDLWRQIEVPQAPALPEIDILALWEKFRGLQEDDEIIRAYSGLYGSDVSAASKLLFWLRPKGKTFPVLYTGALDALQIKYDPEDWNNEGTYLELTRCSRQVVQEFSEGKKKIDFKKLDEAIWVWHQESKKEHLQS
ncbi:MAG: hypothetical protein AAF530_13880 [Pseudomonadota bacterium]